MKLEEFLKQLINELNAQGIRYCILRNYETLPKILKSGDIDFLIESKHKEQVEKIINSIKDIYIIGITKRSYVQNFFLHNIDKGGTSNALQVDFIFNHNYRGMEYLNISNILVNSRKYNTDDFSFNISSKHDETFIKFIPQYLHNGIINPKYHDEIIQELRNSNTIFFNSFNIVNQDLVEKVYKSIINNNFVDMKKTSLLLKKELMKNVNIKKYIYHNLLEIKLRLPFQNSKVIFVNGSIEKLDSINIELESCAKKIVLIDIRNICNLFKVLQVNKNFTIYIFYISRSSLDISMEKIIEKLIKV